MKTTLVKSQNDAVTLAWISQSNTFHADIYKRSGYWPGKALFKH